jgi:FMN-dependent NADH-azoreductase
MGPEHSASRKVCDTLIADMKAGGGVEGVSVTELDLAAMTADGSLEPYTAKRVMAKVATFGAGSALADGEAMTTAGLDDGSMAEWGFTQGLIKQFSEHDVYVFGVPMWNFGIPFHLKVN